MTLEPFYTKLPILTSQGTRILWNTLNKAIDFRPIL